MKIIREVLKNGKEKVVASYDGITTQTAHSFMVKAAAEEAARRKRPKIRHIAVESDSLSGRSTATLVDSLGRSVVLYRQEWPKPGEQ